MDNIDNIQQIKIYVEANKTGDDTYEFIWTDRSVKKGVPEFDFFVSLFLTRTNEVKDYVQIDQGEEVEPVPRQEVNPFFMEYGFFDGIEQTKVLKGSQLTTNMIERIREVRPDVREYPTPELREWFDDIGINEFPWNKGTLTETTLDTLDRLNTLPSHIISKANYFNIDINK